MVIKVTDLGPIKGLVASSVQKNVWGQRFLIGWNCPIIYCEVKTLYLSLKDH